MNETLDPRLHAVRPELADIRLRGRVEADRFAEGVEKRILEPTAPVRRQPRPDAPLDTEALHGEPVRVFEETAEGWAWAQLESDGYVGWMPTDALAVPAGAPTHRVRTLRSFVYPGPDMKLPPIMALSINARITVRAEQGGFAETEAGFIVSRHLAGLDEFEPDWVATATRFVGTPYLWGGRTSLGLDCSALIQLSLMTAGIACPRDSDMQAGGIGEPVDHSDPARFARGDLLFWRGHVAIVHNGGMLLHASGHHMETVLEPMTPALERIAASGTVVSAARRISTP